MVLTIYEQVIPDRSPKKMALLQHDISRFPNARLLQLLYRYAVQPQIPGRRRAKLEQQLNQLSITIDSSMRVFVALFKNGKILSDSSMKNAKKARTSY